MANDDFSENPKLMQWRIASGSIPPPSFDCQVSIPNPKIKYNILTYHYVHCQYVPTQDSRQQT